MTISYLKPVYDMRDLALIGFFCGPLGLGVALFLSLQRVGRSAHASTAMNLCAALFVVELVVSYFALVNVIYLHLFGAVLAKVLYDRWLLVPSRNFLKEGGMMASGLQVALFILLFSTILLAAFLGVGSLALALGSEVSLD
jgi:hypothetical protein